MNEEFLKLDMGQLCDKLQENETEQNKIYQVYIKAAEFDEDLRELKRKEKIIRMCMKAKINQG